MKRFSAVVLCCLSLLSISRQVLAQEQVKYKIVDLGKSDFPTDKLGQILNQAQMVFTPCLNRDGSIIAWYIGRGPDTKAFIHQVEQAKTDPFPGQGKNIAHVGKFTGKLIAGAQLGPPPHAFFMELGGKESSVADGPNEIHAINKNGQMAGWELSGNSDSPHALVVAADGNKQLIPPHPGDGMSIAVDVNDLGVVLGNSFGIDKNSGRGGEAVHAFLLRPGAKPEWLDAQLPLSIARAINDSGAIAGASRQTAEGQIKACIWQTPIGKIKRVELLGGERSNALCISETQAAGWLQKKVGDIPQAAIWSLANLEAKLVDDLLHPDSKDWKVVAVTAISANQAIAGIAIAPNKEVHLFYGKPSQ